PQAVDVDPSDGILAEKILHVVQVGQLALDDSLGAVSDHLHAAARGAGGDQNRAGACPGSCAALKAGLLPRAMLAVAFHAAALRIGSCSTRGASAGSSRTEIGRATSR